ncbi:hypothetical protein [Agrococcus versicolor]
MRLRSLPLALAVVVALGVGGCAGQPDDEACADVTAIDEAYETLDEALPRQQEGTYAGALIEQTYLVEEAIDAARDDATDDGLVASLDRIADRIQELREAAGDLDFAVSATITAVDYALSEADGAIDDVLADVCR